MAESRQSFHEAWDLYKSKILDQELEALRARQDNLNDDTSIQYHFGRGGHYTFLSENYRHKFTYDDKDWPTAQHAYQTRKFPGIDEKHENIRAQIESANEPRMAKEIAERWKESADNNFCQGWTSRDFMYDILCHKFNLRGPAMLSEQLIRVQEDAFSSVELALRLLKTGNKPIYHITDKDNFWGVVKVPDCEEDLIRDGNWNGRILSVIRLQLLEIYNGLAAQSLDVTALMNTMVKRGNEYICPAADGSEVGFLRNQYKVIIPNNSTIGGRYTVQRPKRVDPGSYSGQCYICHDNRSNEDGISHTISAFLDQRTSLAGLKDFIKLIFDKLIQNINPPELWVDLLSEDGKMNRVERERFPNRGQSPQWWIELCIRMQSAQQLAVAGHCLLAAHTLHNLLHSPAPNDAEEGRIFLKSFKPDAVEHRVLREILQCSTRSPDLTTRDERERLCHHEGVSVIYGGSHSAQVLLPANAQPARIAFVAMEYCPGLDLFDLCACDHWKNRAIAALDGSTGKEGSDHICLVRALTHQLAMAVAHMHRCKVAHGDLKAENVMVSAGGRVRLIDYGFMTQLPPARADDIVETSYSAPELSEALPDTDPERLASLLQGNDVWMLAHLVLNLLVSRKMLPAGGKWQWKGPKQSSLEYWLSNVTDSDGRPRRLWDRMGKNMTTQLDLLKSMYAPAGQRCGVKDLMKDVYWVVDAATGAAGTQATMLAPPVPRDALPHALNPFFVSAAKLPGGECFVPDLLLVPCAPRGGWLVARASAKVNGSNAMLPRQAAAGPAGHQLGVGDLVIAIDGQSIDGEMDAAEPHRWRGKYNSTMELSVRREGRGDEAVDKVRVLRLIDMRETANLLRRDGPTGDGAAGPAGVPERFRAFVAEKIRRGGGGGQPSSPGQQQAPQVQGIQRDAEADFVEFEGLMGECGWSLPQVLQAWVARGWVETVSPLTLRPSFLPPLDEKQRAQARARREVTGALEAFLGDESRREMELDGLDRFGRYVAYVWCRPRGLTWRKKQAPEVAVLAEGGLQQPQQGEGACIVISKP